MLMKITPGVLLVEGGDVVRQVALGREHFVAEVTFHLCAAVGDRLVFGEALQLDELLVTDEANELQLLEVGLLLMAVQVVLLVERFGAVIALPILTLADCLIRVQHDRKVRKIGESQLAGDANNLASKC